MKKLYVGNLSYTVDEQQLKDLFAQAGLVSSVQVIKFHDTGKSKGFGFVEMTDEQGANKAIEMFNEQDHMGRRLIVSEAKPMKPREQRSY